MVPLNDPQPLERSDLGDLLQLERMAQAYPASAVQLQAALEAPDQRLFGIHQHRRLLGYAHVVRLPFDAELQSILVAPHVRRGGTARRLMATVVEQASAWGSEKLLLEVRLGNVAAIGLYKGLGFVEDGRRRNYYPSLDGAGREDALLMSRLLSAA